MMPLTTLSLAAIPAKFAIPVLAGLVVGTSALGAYLTQPTPVSASVIAEPAFSTAAIALRPCDQQAWPYIDRGCAVQATSSSRAVRVIAPRVGDGAEKVAAIPAPQAAIDEATTSIKLTSRDTVLRAPELAPAPRVVKSNVRRTETRQDRRWVAQSYQVPAETRDTGARAIVVVRPLRAESLP